MQEESIYNLIPKEYVAAPKQPLYRSRFTHTVPPSYSTFGHHTTSVPKVSNANGNFEITRGGHSCTAKGATFGKPKGSCKPDVKTWTKKGTGKMGGTYLPEIRGTFKYDETCRKAPVPKKDEAPIHGLVTGKNYVLANKVENMLAQTKVMEQPMDWTRKKEYGRVPKYLERIKEQTLREYEHIKALHQHEQEQHDSEKYYLDNNIRLINHRFLLSEEEVQGLREGLKKKWDVVNKEYQLLTHKSVLDTIGLRRRKENCEKELTQLEKDLEKLHRGYILVDGTH